MFKEVIVVEGRDDTKRLREVFGNGLETIETGGSAINKLDIQRIIKAQASRGVIIFTDPDFNGKRIRNIITKAVPEAKHAFITRSDAAPAKAGGSLGVEHASDQVIKAALSQVHTVVSSELSDLTFADLIDLKLVSGAQARQLRIKVGDILGIGYFNAKQFYRAVRMYGLNKSDLQEAIKALENK